MCQGGSVSWCLAVIVLGAAEDEGTFWIQLLMVVILAAGVGIYGLVKSRAKRLEQETRDETIETIIEPPEPLVKKRNLSGGMELLARNFLVGVVEQTGSPDQRDIEMRRLCFAELVRRGELWAIVSTPLKFTHWTKTDFTARLSAARQWRNWPDARVNRHRMPPTPHLLSKTARDWKQQPPKGK